MSKTTLEEAIEAIPGEDGWWKSHAESTYLSTAKQLIERGFSEDEAADLLDSLYWAAADCYGG